MPIHHSKQFFRNLSCPLSELQPLGVHFFVVAAKISPNKRKKKEKLSHGTFAFFSQYSYCLLHHNISTMCTGFT